MKGINMSQARPLYATFTMKGREYLVEVTDIYRREFPYPCYMAKIRDLNGQDVEGLSEIGLTLLDILER